MKKNKIIIGLILINLIFGIIFGLKVTGILKPNKGNSSQEIVSEIGKDMETSIGDLTKSTINFAANGETEGIEDGLNSFQSDFTYSMQSGGMNKLMKKAWTYLIIFMIIGIILYSFAAIGLKKIADEEGYKGWKAWLPLGNTYILFQVAFDNNIIKWFALVASILINTKTGDDKLLLPATLNMILALALLALTIFALYKVFTKKSDKAIYMIVALVTASIIAYFLGIPPYTIAVSFGLVGPFMLFAIRNK